MPTRVVSSLDVESSVVSLFTFPEVNAACCKVLTEVVLDNSLVLDASGTVVIEGTDAEFLDSDDRG